MYGQLHKVMRSCITAPVFAAEQIFWVMYVIETGEVIYTTLTDHSKTAQSHLQRCPNPCLHQTPSDIHHIYLLNHSWLEWTTWSTTEVHIPKIGTAWYGGVYVWNVWQKHYFQEIHPGACKNMYFLNFQPGEDRYLHLEDFVGWNSTKISWVKRWEQISCYKYSYLNFIIGEQSQYVTFR